MKYLFIILLPLSAYTQTITPGMWHSEAHFKLNGIPMPPKSDDSCVTDAEAKNPKKEIEDSLKRNDCKLTKWEMKKTNVSASVECKSEQYEAKGSIKGTYEKKKYQLEGSISGNHRLLGNATADVTFSGKWTGSCKK